MELSADAVYARQDDVVLRDVAGEQILVPIRHNVADLQAVFVLNGIGAFVWGLLDGISTLAVIHGQILDQYDVAPEDAWADLGAFIGELSQAGLVLSRS
jgi:hypothetical protein